MRKFLSNKINLAIAYKLLNDLLFIALIFFFAAIIADGLIPGIISSHISFTRVILFVSLDLLFIYFLAGQAGISLKKSPINKKISAPTLFLLVLLIFNSLFKLNNIALNLFVTLLIGLSGYFIYKIILEES